MAYVKRMSLTSRIWTA